MPSFILPAFHDEPLLSKFWIETLVSIDDAFEKSFNQRYASDHLTSILLFVFDALNDGPLCHVGYLVA